jgi:hypothetical protein
LLIGVVAVAALALCIAWWMTRSPANVVTATPAPVAGAAASAANDESFHVLGVERETPNAQAGERPPAPYPAELFDPRRYEGNAHLRVFASVKQGAQFPRAWSLLFEPSKTLIGGEHAVPRRFDFKNGETKLEVDDLALGGYDVRAEAQGMCSLVQQQLFSKPNDVDVVMQVELYPAGFLAGRVIDAHSQAVEGLPVALESKTDRARREVLTDPAGNYVFESVTDGDYWLFAGNPDAPLAPPRDVAFLAPTLHMPDIEVPVLGEVSVRVVTSSGAPVADAKVECFGNAGGRGALVTDVNGRALARFLPAGTVRFVASTSSGAVGREQFDLEPGARGEIEIKVRE